MIENFEQAMNARYIIEKSYEWRKWIKEIPYLNFKEDWNVKIIPHLVELLLDFKLHIKMMIKHGYQYI